METATWLTDDARDQHVLVFIWSQKTQLFPENSPTIELFGSKSSLCHLVDQKMTSSHATRARTERKNEFQTHTTAYAFAKELKHKVRLQSCKWGFALLGQSASRINHTTHMLLD